MKHKPKIAIVVQRYGEEVSGGAELHARWLAEHLTSFAHIEVITSCAVDYLTWENVYPAGTTTLNNIPIHRHPVDKPRNWQTFSKQTKQLLNNPPSVPDQIDWMRQQGPLSTPMLNHIAQRDYDAYIFFTYLYAHTFYGLPLVSEKALLVPTAHDEPFLYLPIFRPTFHLPRAIVYNTQTEKELVNRITHNHTRPDDIIAGIGINVPPTASAERFRQKYNIQGDFLLYVGRIAGSKNVSELFDHYQAYAAQQPNPPQLILIGKAHLPIPEHPHIKHLGFVSEQDKFDAIQAAILVTMPSRFESLSMIVLEAWHMQTPVLVNGQCEVLKQLCRQSNGGLYYHNYDEFFATLSHTQQNPTLTKQLGLSGHKFVQETYHWDIVTDKYARLLNKLLR